MHRRQARPLSGVVEPSKLVIPQREVAVAPFHIRTGALEHLREPGRLSLERDFVPPRSMSPTLHPAQTTGCGALSQLTQRLACGYRPRRGHTVEIA